MHTCVPRVVTALKAVTGTSRSPRSGKLLRRWVENMGKGGVVREQAAILPLPHPQPVCLPVQAEAGQSVWCDKTSDALAR